MYEPARPLSQVIQQNVDGRQNHQGNDRREGQAAYDGAGHREIRRAVATDLSRAYAQRDQPEHSGRSRHDNGAKAVVACLKNGGTPVQAGRAQVVDMIDQNDPIVYHNSNQDQNPDPGHDLEGRARNQEEPENPNNGKKY